MKLRRLYGGGKPYCLGCFLPRCSTFLIRYFLFLFSVIYDGSFEKLIFCAL